MPHRPPPPALRLVAGRAPPAIRVDAYGLTLVHLGPAHSARRPPPPLLLGELDPPRPGGLAAVNPSGRPVTLTPGRLVTGGMSDRAVAAAVVVRPGTTSVVPVEPLSARWWPAGPPQADGRLPPALTALLVLAGHGGAGLRSIARTALWDGYRRHPAPDRIDHASGWLLLRGRTVLAAHLVGVPAPWPPATPAVSPCLPPGDLGTGADADPGLVRLSHGDGREARTWLVRASAELADLVLAGASSR